MSIPKIIHYCWFGKNPKPKLAKKCIKSWSKFCSDYEIIEWNEDNFNISSCPLYVQQAYEAKKWAFVTDYVRLKVVYDHGGIYLDTDVELIKPLDSLLEYNAYFGFEDGCYIATGLGFGATKGNSVIKAIMDDYHDIPFIQSDGSFDTTTCPMRNTRILEKYGLRKDNSLQILNNDVCVLPKEYLCPIDYWNKQKSITNNTVSIHHFSSSWQTQSELNKLRRMRKKERSARVVHIITHIPNILLKTLLGKNKYKKLKNKLKKR